MSSASPKSAVPKSAASKRSVVITGMSLATPAGYTLEENRTAWREGKHCFTEIQRFNTSGSSVKYAGDCPEPNIKKLPDRKVTKILRRKDVISLLATMDAATHAGLVKGQVDPERFGMYVGAGSTQIGDLTPYFLLVAECANADTGSFDSVKFGRELMSLVNPLVVLQTLMNNALCFGSMTLDIRGVNANFMDFQAAGLRAVGEAFRSIATGRCDVALAGGVAGPVEPFQLAEGVHTGYLATTSQLQQPLGEVVKPYDRQRCGAILSEGSAYIVLEEEAHALRRGARILGRMHGFGLASDGSFEYMDSQDSPGLVRAMQWALADAQLQVNDLACVIGHGNGSLRSDLAEARAYAEFFGAAAAKLPLCSPKAVLGDMSEAGGVLGVILALQSLSDGVVPPTFNFHQGDEYSSRLALRAEAQALHGDRALITARNFLGLSTAVVIGAA